MKGETASPDKIGVKLGMWLFLYTEIMLFGGLFVLYAAYYTRYTVDFIQGGKSLDLFMGAFNTIILLTSSFTVAASFTLNGAINSKWEYIPGPRPWNRAGMEKTFFTDYTM